MWLALAIANNREGDLSTAIDNAWGLDKVQEHVHASKGQGELWKTGGKGQERNEAVRRFEKLASGKQKVSPISDM